MIVPSAQYVCRIDQEASVVWRLLREFTEIPWMMGVQEVSAGNYQGHIARMLHMPGIEPITEYLLDLDDEQQSLQYGVVKNPFVPVDGYKATIAVNCDDGQTQLSFSSSYEQGDQAAEEITQMLEGFYQMMATSIDTYLQDNQSI
jgi:hypothetical protein